MTDTDARVDLVVRAAETGAEVALESFRGELSVETKTGKTDFVTETDRKAEARVIETIREEFPNDVIVGEEGVERRSTERASGKRSGQRAADDAPKRVPDEGASWVIDPIDGTSNFVRGLRIWGTSVATIVDGEPVAAATVFPALSDTYAVGRRHVTRNSEPVRVSTREDPETFGVVPILLGRDPEPGRVVSTLAERFGDLRRFGCSHATLAAVADGSLEVALATQAMSPWDTVGGVHMIRAAGGTVTDLAGERWRHDSRSLVASNGLVHDEVLAVLGRIVDE